MPHVSVIVPVRNDAARLRLCLQALQLQTYPREQFEIIVIDNASDDDVLAVTSQFAGVTLLHEDKLGPAAARNAGIKQAKGEYIAFTDSDCQPEAIWLEQGISCLSKQGPMALVGGKIIIRARNQKSPTAVELYDQLYHLQQEHSQKTGFFVTANLFIFAQLLKTIGPFDVTNFPLAGEDVDLCHRATQAGAQLVYCEQAVVHHPATPTLQKKWQQQRYYLQAHRPLCKKWSTFTAHQKHWLPVTFFSNLYYIWQSPDLDSYIQRIKVMIVFVILRVQRSFLRVLQ